MLHIWGSTCYAHVPKTKRPNPKFSNRAIECKLLGLSASYKGYRLLAVKRNQYLTARDVKFGVTTTASLITKSFPPEVLNLSEEDLNEVYVLGKRVRESVAHSDTTIIRPHTNSPIPTSSAAVGGEAPRMSVAPIPRPRRKRTPNSRLRDYVVAINVATIKTKAIPIPQSLKEARHGPYAKQWEAALQASGVSG
ncbi:unnamed protein product [Phytophthora fragariaefolia]|uniref:Unnamed protein product n=1 Tax=Phytophthora fragariaefolia TaxID=1490495 RepID=A0A9W6YQ07_9STRA|nr:unnamed protein product [Phytophthora fragariaefolia]